VEAENGMVRVSWPGQKDSIEFKQTANGLTRIAVSRGDRELISINGGGK
jgi:hypothetical protein